MKNPGDVADVLARRISRKLGLTGGQEVIVWELVESYYTQNNKERVRAMGKEGLLRTILEQAGRIPAYQSEIDRLKSIIETALAEEEVVPAGEEIVRVLRLVEFEGPRELVEKQIAHSVHGTRVFQPKPDKKEVRITAVTLDCFPEVLELARQSPEPGLLKDLRDTIQKLEAQLKLAREGRE